MPRAKLNKKRLPWSKEMSIYTLTGMDGKEGNVSLGGQEGVLFYPAICM